MKTIYSAIQPSGIMTLGNYIGAVDNWHRMQSDINNKCLFALAVSDHGCGGRVLLHAWP